VVTRQVEPLSLLRCRHVDELATVFLILRTAAEEDEVRQLLPSLEIVVGAHATDTVAQGASNAASAARKQDLASETIPGAQALNIIRKDDRTFVIWKLALHLPQPRSLQRPAVYLTANVMLKSGPATVPRESEKDYLKPFESLPENVLAPLNFAPEFRDKHIYLSADRVTKVTPPAVPKEDGLKPVRGASKRAFPVVPAIFTGINCTVVPEGTIASIYIQISAAIAGKFTIKNVKVTIPDVNPYEALGDVQTNLDKSAVQAINPLSWPRELQAGDEIVLLYKVNGRHSNAHQPSPLKGPTTIDVSVSASGVLETGSRIELDTSWKAQVERSQETQTPAYQWSRPTSAASSHKSLSSKLSQHGPSSKGGFTNPTSTDEGGVTFLISAPPTTSQHASFKLKVQCTNKSNLSRHFGLSIVLPKLLPNWQASRPASKPGTASTDVVAEVLSAPRLEPQKSRSVELGSGDVKLGPVEGGATDEAWIKLRATATGVLDLGILRITDLVSQSTVEVHELPDVIALEAIKEHEGDAGWSDRVGREATTVITARS